MYNAADGSTSSSLLRIFSRPLPHGILNHQDSLIATAAAQGTDESFVRETDEERKSQLSNSKCMWQCAKQEGDYEAVAKQSRSSKKATRRGRERRAAAWLFHRVTANSLAACQDEAPREREERRKLDRLVFGG